MLTIFCKKCQRFLTKIVPLLKPIVRELCYRFFSSVFSFCKIGYSKWKLSFTDYTSGIWFLDCSKLPVTWKNSNYVTIFWQDVIVKFFWCCFVSLVQFIYWSKFHVNIITGSVVMLILFIRGWPEIWKSELSRLSFAQ